jgi:hypothetical protein
MAPEKKPVRVRLYRNPKDASRDGQIVRVLRKVNIYKLEVMFDDGTREIMHRNRLKCIDLLPTQAQTRKGPAE